MRAPEPASHATRALAVGLYLTALALVAHAVAQAATMGSSSAPVWSLHWRFAFVGFIMAYLYLPLLGLAIGVLTATLLGHRRVLLAMLTVQVLLALVAILAFGSFLLDSTQLAATLQPGIRGRFTMTILHSSLNGGLGVLLMIVLAVSTVIAFRRQSTPRRSRGMAGNAPPLVGDR